MVMANNYKVFGLEEIPDDYFLTIVGSFGALSNGFSRAIWAMMLENYGFKKVYFMLLLVQVD